MSFSPLDSEIFGPLFAPPGMAEVFADDSLVAAMLRAEAALARCQARVGLAGHGLAEAIDMLNEEGLDNVFARHDRHAEATRRAARAWGLEILCLEPREYSSALTALLMPEGHDADRFRKLTLEAFDMSLGAGLAKVAGKVFRIGHLGSFNDLTLMGTLAGVDMGLELAGVPHRKGGVAAAMAYLADCAAKPAAKAAQ
jgi:alanine-glyoxylate transaminase/serine-glyoxylate transaminase/serine-pyruvate transaminase